MQVRVGKAVEQQAFIGRLAAPNQNRKCPARVTFDGHVAVTAAGANGPYREGRQADMKPDMHWLLTPNAAGELVLRPVVGWFEFGKEMATSSHAKAGANASQPSRKRPLEDGESQIKKVAAARKADEDRWTSLLEKRDQKNGVKFTRDMIFTGAAADGKRGDSYDEQERLKDELGFQREQKKKLKARKKEAGDKADVDEVPDSANALLNLKSERAEGVWDFAAEDEFSDDEQDQDDFNDELQVDNQEDQAPSADEDEAPDAEEGDLLTHHGKELEVLLQQSGEGGQMDGEGNADPDDDEAPSDGSVPLQDIPAKVAEPDRAVPQRPAASRERVRKEPPAQATARVETARQATAAPAVKPEPAPAAKPEPAPAADDLQSKVVKCMADRGGRCKLADIVAAIGLKDKKSALYQSTVAIIKQVASVEQAPGQERALLVLKPEHRR